VRDSHGVGTARAVRIYKTYGGDAVQVMSENPYRLARDIRGIGVKTADAIAMKLGVDKAAMVRVRAGISYALTEAMDEGHCGLPTDYLVPLAEKLLEVPQELVRTAHRARTIDLIRIQGAEPLSKGLVGLARDSQGASVASPRVLAPQRERRAPRSSWHWDQPPVGKDSHAPCPSRCRIPGERAAPWRAGKTASTP
jgi:ATP-dependent exoDNAse (exonuclease V) alpha subunit